jgi:hypothetical protein
VDNRVLVFADALDVAAEGAVWYRRISGGTSRGSTPSKSTYTGIYARWLDFTAASHGWT